MGDYRKNMCETEGEELVRVEQLVKNYGKAGESEKAESAVKVLKAVDFCVNRQEFVGIMGKSGCGASVKIRLS